MSVFNTLKSFAFSLQNRRKSDFTYPVEKQRRYISHFPEPHDDIERSYYQYRCQMKLNGILAVFLNAFSLPLLLCTYHKRNSELINEKTDALFLAGGVDSFGIVPDLLRKRFDSWKEINELKEYFDENDRIIFKKIVKCHPFSWHFLLKILVKIRIYSYLIKSYNPTAIVAASEYSFSSSAMTYYCESYGKLHIDVQHGEKYFYMRDAFFRFSTSYVWDDYYVKLFGKMRAPTSQFIISMPEVLLFSNEKETIKAKSIDYTYYLADEKGKVLERILENLIKLKEAGFRVALRPHPIYSNLHTIHKVVKEIEIEDHKSLSAMESIKRTNHAISLASTMLNQAYYNGTGVVIDDISQPKKYKKLEELQYVMLEKRHVLLSTIINSVTSIEVSR